MTRGESHVLKERLGRDVQMPLAFFLTKPRDEGKTYIRNDQIRHVCNDAPSGSVCEWTR